MNYRHIYHAGNISDVVKHTVLTLLLTHLHKKDTGFCVIDTHAGVGRYNLQDERALKTNEAQDGIYKLLKAPPLFELADYYAVLKKLNPETFHIYPGSPLLAFTMLRPQDRLVACELHKDDFHELRRLFQDKPQAQIHHRDGYETLIAFIPPAEKRGLVLIDPPYEQPDELERLPERIAEAHRRWPHGQFVIWYPIKERPALWHFHEALTATGIPKQLCAEFIYDEETRHDRLNGCGLILINPPWQMGATLQKLFTDLHKAMKTHHHGVTVKWLTPE